MRAAPGDGGVDGADGAGWPERLLPAGVGVLLAAVALPWGSGGGDAPVVLTQAGRPGVFVLGAAVALVAAVLVVAGGVARPLAPVVRIAGGVAALGALLVRGPDGGGLPLLVPGRIVAVLGAVALVTAAGSLDEPARAMAPTAGTDREPSSGGAGRRRSAWVAVAVVCAGGGALALTGPWWRSGFEVTGPYAELLDGGQAAAAVRSGVDILGAARAWLVGVVVVVAVGAVVWPGGRRAAPVVALAGVVVAATGVAAGASDQAGRSPVVVAAGVGLGVAGAALATVVWWWGSTGAARAGLLLVAVPGVLAAWPVDGPGVPAVTTDGPFEVVAGADVGVFGGDQPVADGMPAAEVSARGGYPVWVDGRPGLVAWADADGVDGVDGVDGAEVDDRRPVLWTVDGGGRVDVEAVGPASLPGDGVAVGFAGDAVLFRSRDEPAHLWSLDAPDRAVALPGGPGDVPTLGPDGAAWIMTLPYRPEWGEAPATPGPVRTTDVGALLRGGASIDDLPEGPELPVGTLEVLPGRDGGSIAVLEDRILALDADGATRRVFGGAVDGACGLNGTAAESFVAAGELGLAVENDGRYRGGAEVGRRGYVAVALRGGGPDPAVVPLWTAEPAAGGGLWVALPVPTEEDDDADTATGGAHQLAWITPDGEVRVVDHRLPGIRFVAVDPDGGAVLVAGHDGRLLRLDDPEAATTPLAPPPDDCYPELPEVAPAARLTPVAGERPADEGAVLVDTAGTRLLARESGGATEIVRLPATGGEQAVAEAGGRVLALGPDGAGGAWWLEAPAGAAEEADEERREVDAVAVHLRAGGQVERGPSLPVGTSTFRIVVATYGDPDVVYVADAHGTRPRPTDRGIGTVGDHRLRRIAAGRVEPVYDAPADAPVMVDSGPRRSLAVTAAGDVMSVDGGEVRRLAGDAFEAVAGVDPDDVGDRPARPLPVHLAASTPTGEVPVVGAMVADPAGGGVLVAQDGVLVRVGPDGRFTPVAQDPRLDGVDLAVFDGRIVATDTTGQPFVVEVVA